jgi:hypothetical protein
MAEQEKKLRGRITGAWKKTGPYGDFFKGKFSKSFLLEELAKFDDGVVDFDVYISKLNNKTKENDPDVLVTFEPHKPYVKPE